MANIESFRQRLKKKKSENDEDHWLNSNLKFHVDSINAFAISKNKEAVDETKLNYQLKNFADNP